VKLLRLLLLHEDDLLYEPTAAEARLGRRVVDPMPTTVIVSSVSASVSSETCTATVTVAPK
jgi:hypothetical protein